MSFFSNIFGGAAFSTEEEIKSVLKEDHLIMDVRTEQEFAQGHIAGAVNVPVHMVGHYIEDIKKQKKKIILYCRSGARASSALSLLQRNGIEAYNAGGIMQLQSIINQQ